MPDASAAAGDKTVMTQTHGNGRSPGVSLLSQWRDDNTKFVKRLSPWEYANFKQAEQVANAARLAVGCVTLLYRVVKGTKHGARTRLVSWEDCVAIG